MAPAGRCSGSRSCTHCPTGSSASRTKRPSAARTSPYQFRQFWVQAGDDVVERYLLQFTLRSVDDMVGRVDTERKSGDTLNYVYVVGDDKLSSDLKVISEAVNARNLKMTLDYVRQRQAFGATLWQQQTIRQRIAMLDAKTRAARLKPPRSTTWMVPARRAPSGVSRPILRWPKVTVSSAWMQIPSGEPLSASRPDGRSSATMSLSRVGLSISRSQPCLSGL